jgi:hypothetical protein
MKKFFLKFFFLLLLPSIITTSAAYILDPFNVFHYKNIRDNGVEPNKNYIKMRYILDNPGKFDAFLFGSSRVGGIDVAAIPGLHCYNMTYSVGLPKEHFENLEVMIQKNIIPNTVLLGVDDIACYARPENHHKQLLRMPYPNKAAQDNFAYFSFLLNYLKPNVLASIPVMVSYKGNNARFWERFYENGGRVSGDDDRLAQKTNWEMVSVVAQPFHYGIENTLADIQSIIDLCSKNNIKLIVFTNPLHKLTYQKAVEHGYIDFLEKLVEITAYYNFSGINDITTNNDNYLETSHYKLKTGDLIIDAIFNNKIDDKLLSQGFGWYVTPHNKGDFINLLRKQQIEKSPDLQSSGLLQ